MPDIRELGPILITSPAIRSGTTVLQRLLCSSSNALIYGEEIGKDLELQLQIFSSRKMVYTHSRQRFASSLDRVMRGDNNDWILDLMPDIDGYLEVLHQGAFAGLAHCHQHALKAGRSLWGFKYPGWPPYMMRMLFDTMASTRVIYIFRELADCARSAKAWRAINNDVEMQHFCTQWVEHRKFMQQWQQEHSVLILPFETLVQEPEQAIERLCSFLPFENIDQNVLQNKINNLSQGIDTRHQHNAYIEPATLTTSEQACIEAAIAAVSSSA